MSESDARRERAAAMQDEDGPDIPPALTFREWVRGRTDRGDLRIELENGDMLTVSMPPSATGIRADAVRWGITISGMADDFAALIALANAALPDEDPRKLRREHVEVLRSAPDGPGDVSPLFELADAIESFLPPETPNATERQA